MLVLCVSLRADLSAFVGDFNRRYQHMDLEPILQYMMNRLSRGQPADLSIFQSVISIMSGMPVINNDTVSAEQLKAFGAGPELVLEALNPTFAVAPSPLAGASGSGPGGAGGGRGGGGGPGGNAGGTPAPSTGLPPSEKKKSTKMSLPRLMAALKGTEMAVPLWIALAQTTQYAVDGMGNVPIKAMSILQDNVSGSGGVARMLVVGDLGMRIANG
jgi:THO complex subunit 2